MIEIESTSPAATEAVAAQLASCLRPGDVIAVAGELGAGKTTFVRGACRALGVAGAVTSPTFTIGNRYEGRVPVAHLDLYRFDALGETDWGDLETLFDGAVAFVEWPDRGQGVLPTPRARVELEHRGPETRLVRFATADGDLGAALAELEVWAY